MQSEAALVGFALLALGAMFGLCWVVREALSLAWKTHEQACIVSRSQQEAATKYVTAISQTANLISEKIDARVSARVKTVNMVMRGQKPDDPVEEIEDPPQPPDVFQSGFVNELSEITREMTRHRRDDEEYPAREMGIGAEEV